jgi:Flp pilus assembly pilin Flp
MLRLIKRCLKDESGTECLEYALVMGLIVVGTLGLMSAMGIKVAEKWEEIASAMDL